MSVIRNKHISLNLSVTLVSIEINDAIHRKDLSAWHPIQEIDLFDKYQGLVMFITMTSNMPNLHL